jgi:ankyrin repeat protein
MAAESKFTITPLFPYCAWEDAWSSTAAKKALLAQAERFRYGKGIPQDLGRAALYYLEIILRSYDSKPQREGYHFTSYSNFCVYSELWWHSGANILELYKETDGSNPYVSWALSACHSLGHVTPQEEKDTINPLRNPKNYPSLNEEAIMVLQHLDQRFWNIRTRGMYHQLLTCTPSTLPTDLRNKTWSSLMAAIEQAPKINPFYLIQISEALALGINIPLTESMPSFLKTLKRQNYAWTLSAIRQRVHVDVLQQLHDKNLDAPLARTGLSPLLSLIKVGDEDLAIHLINEGADLEQKTSHKENVLHIAAMFNATNVLEKLYKTSIRSATDEPDARGYTPLHHAAEQGHLDSILLLLGPDQDQDQDDFDTKFLTTTEKFSPLHLAVKNNHYELCYALLPIATFKKQIDLRDHQGRTPLHLAVAQGYRETTIALLEFGASLTEKDKEGRTPLCTAILNQKNNLARLLLINGAELPLEEKSIPSSSSSETPTTLSREACTTLFDNIKQELRKARLTIYKRKLALQEQSEIDTSSELAMLNALDAFIVHHPDRPLPYIIAGFKRSERYQSFIKSSPASSTKATNDLAAWIDTLVSKEDKRCLVLEIHIDDSAIPASITIQDNIQTAEKKILQTQDKSFWKSQREWLEDSNENFRYYLQELYTLGDTQPSHKDISEPLETLLYVQEEHSLLCVDATGNTLLHWLSGANFEQSFRLNHQHFLVFNYLRIFFRSELKFYLHHQNHYGNTPFLLAAMSGNMKVLRILLEEMPFSTSMVSHQNYRKENALHLAARYNQFDVCKFLLPKMPFELLNARNFEGDTPLHLAAVWVRFDNVLRIRLLLLNGADPIMRNHQSCYCIDSSSDASRRLHHDLEFEHVTAKRTILLKIKSDPTSQEILTTFLTRMADHPYRPLLVIVDAFISRYSEVTQEIQDFLQGLISEEDRKLSFHKPDPQFLDTSGRFEVTTSNTYLYNDVADVLLGIDKNTTEPTYSINVHFAPDYTDARGYTHLHFIACKPREDFWQNRGKIEFLLSSTVLGQRTMTRDKYGNTPFHIAASYPHLDMLELFYNAFVHWNCVLDPTCTPEMIINATNQASQTPLHKAAVNHGYIFSNVSFLLKCGATLDPRDNKGNTPLHNAAENSNLYGASLMTRWLLLNGANPDIKNNEGKTPWEVRPEAFQQIEDEHCLAIVKIFNIQQALEKTATPLEMTALEDLTNFIRRHPHRPLALLMLAFKTKASYQAGVQASQQRIQMSHEKKDSFAFSSLVDGFIFEEREYHHIVRSSILPETDQLVTIKLQKNWHQELISNRHSPQKVRNLVEGWFIFYRIDPLQLDAAGNTFLHTAAQYNISIINYLLTTELASYIMLPNHAQRTPFVIAAGYGHVDIMKALYIKFMAEPIYRLGTPLYLIKDQDNNLPLHLAAQYGHIKVCEYLLSFSPSLIEINAKNKMGHTPLELAEQGGHAEIVKLLLKAGAKPITSTPTSSSKESFSFSDFFSFFSPASSSIPDDLKPRESDFIIAAKQGDIKTMIRLYQNTPVHEQPELLRSTDLQGNSALHIAALQGNFEVSSFLLAHRAVINHQNNEGDTPLHIAVSENQEEFLKMLLLHDADPTIKNHAGKVPNEIPKHARRVFQLAKNARILKIDAIQEKKKEFPDDHPLKDLLEKLIQILTDQKNQDYCFSTLLVQYIETPSCQKLLKKHSDLSCFLEGLREEGYRQHFSKQKASSSLTPTSSSREDMPSSEGGKKLQMSNS